MPTERATASDGVELAERPLIEAALRRVERRIMGESKMVVPCVPGLIDHYLVYFARLFSAYGKVFTDEETAHFRTLLLGELETGFARSPFATLTLTMQIEPPPLPAVSYFISTTVTTMQEEYDRWVATRTPPLFGEHPDCKVMHAAAELGEPKNVRVLDVGAGTGRNTLALARAGFQVDAVEPVASMGVQIEKALAAERLPGAVLIGDAADARFKLRKRHYQLAFLSGVIAAHTRTPADSRRLLMRVCDTLAPGGILLFDAFLADQRCAVPGAIKGFSEHIWSNVFTYADLDAMLAGLPLERVSDESVYAYEREHTPPAQWPPTGWFAAWAQGLDVLDLPEGASPITLRWIAARKR